MFGGNLPAGLVQVRPEVEGHEFTFLDRSLNVTSFSCLQTPEPALLADHGPTQITGLPARRVPEPVAAPREPLEPVRRRVERMPHIQALTRPYVNARHGHSVT